MVHMAKPQETREFIMADMNPTWMTVTIIRFLYQYIPPSLVCRSCCMQMLVEMQHHWLWPCFCTALYRCSGLIPCFPFVQNPRTHFAILLLWGRLQNSRMAKWKNGRMEWPFVLASLLSFIVLKNYVLSVMGKYYVSLTSWQKLATNNPTLDLFLFCKPDIQCCNSI